MSEKNTSFEHGTPEVWKEIFSGLNLSYSEKPKTQNQLFEKVKFSFLKEIFPKGSIKILEIGSGTAYASLFFAKRGARITAIDINQSILKVAKENFQKEKCQGKFIVADAEKLPFKNNTFEVVHSHGLLEHFKDPEKAISEMARVLKPGGLFFADIVPDRFSVQTFGNIFNFIVTLIFWSLRGKPFLGWKKGIRNFRPLYYENDLSWQEYKQIINKVGIKQVRVRGNRPFPRLTLPGSLDRFYSGLLKPLVPFWKKFDRWDHFIPRFLGSGWWFWGIK